MKLEKILNNLGSLEKNSFIKIVDTIVAAKPLNIKEIDQILLNSDKALKNADNHNIAKIFALIEPEFAAMLSAEFVETSSQLDILIDILSKDGRCIIKQDWFARLYENELITIKQKIKHLEDQLEDEKSDISQERKRDYRIYKACLNMAYNNDLLNNRDAKITCDELSILLTLSKELELSQEEVKLINYMILPVKKFEIDDIINSLKNIGVIFYSRKNSTLYVADEVVRILRKVRKKEIADKFFRRILSLLREPQINLVCRKHNIDRKLSLPEKIKEIISEGISVTTILANDIHKEGTTLTDKKKFLNEFCDKGLMIVPALKGTTLEEKLNNLLLYFEMIENDDKVGISHEGYHKLMVELGQTLPGVNMIIRNEFAFQQENVLQSDFLLDHNLKPIDILDLIPDADLDEFCRAREIKIRGEKSQNILEKYKDSDNLYLENYVNIGCRNLNGLKDSGIVIKESELGLKFESLTKMIFESLGFNVNDKLRDKISTNKDKIDILLDLGNDELILVECKTNKESGYNKFSNVSRQMKSYYNLAEKNHLKVIKSLLVAPEFSDEFINECELEYELNLSLITASSLIKIMEGFKIADKHAQFPYKLIMRDVLINEDRIIKAIMK